MKKNKTSEQGITLIALIIMIVILVIIAAITIRAVTGDEGLIKTTAKSAEEHEIMAYKAQITQKVQSTVMSYMAKGEEPSLKEVGNALNEETLWVKSAVVNEDENISNKDIIVRTTDGYAFQIYYDSLYGATFVEYIGQDDGGEFPNLKARYEIRTASIYSTANDDKKGIAKTELIYRQEIKEPVYENPNGEVKFPVDKYGTGWYVVKTTSNTGKLRYAWVKVTSVSDKIKSPAIILNPANPNGNNNWYNTEVEVTITSNDENIKEIRYMLISGIEEDTKIEDNDINAGNKYNGPFKINKQGFIRILAWVVDIDGAYRSEYTKEEIKIDTKKPTITGIKTNPETPNEKRMVHRRNSKHGNRSKRPR